MVFKISNEEKERYAKLKEYISINNGEFLNLGQLLDFANTRFAKNIALIYKDQKINYQKLFWYAATFANKIKEKDIKPRDRVLLFFENSLEFFIGYYAIAQVGAVVVPLNTFLKDRELQHIIQDAQPALLIASSALLEKLKEEHIALKVPILTEKDMDLQISDHGSLESVPAYLHPDEMAALLYTSGTTGLPKGVMLSAKNIFTNCIQTIARFGMVQDERIFGVLPFFHSLAQLTYIWAPLLMGCTVIIVPKIDRRAILNNLVHQPTIFIGVPALFGLLCLMKTVPLEGINYFITGGDAMPDKIRASFEMLYNRKIGAGYGLSETSPVLTADLEDKAEPTSNVGTPLLGIEVEIRDEHGLVVKNNSIGQIWVKGDNVMLGYYNEPSKTDQVIKEGWFDTGDLGYFSCGGKLIVTGRVKDLIAHKGFKIYPQEVENVILMHPNVLRVAVIGLVDEDVGEIPIAFVQLKEPEELMEVTLQEFCARNLASYKVPRKFICSLEQLPLTAMGKVDKKMLRQKKIV